MKKETFTPLGWRERSIRAHQTTARLPLVTKAEGQPFLHALSCASPAGRLLCFLFVYPLNPLLPHILPFSGPIFSTAGHWTAFAPPRTPRTTLAILSGPQLCLQPLTGTRYGYNVRKSLPSYPLSSAPCRLGEFAVVRGRKGSWCRHRVCARFGVLHTHADWSSGTGHTHQPSPLR